MYAVQEEGQYALYNGTERVATCADVAEVSYKLLELAVSRQLASGE